MRLRSSQAAPVCHNCCHTPGCHTLLLHTNTHFIHHALHYTNLPQVPQFILEAAESAGRLHKVKILAAQPRRLITTGMRVGVCVYYACLCDVLVT